MANEKRLRAYQDLHLRRAIHHRVALRIIRCRTEPSASIGPEVRSIGVARDEAGSCC